MRVVFCSCPSDDATRLAKHIVTERLAACVQIIPTIQSVYWWKGEVCEDQEALLMCKTAADRVEALTDAIRKHHPYEVPEVIAVPVRDDEGNPDYIQWVRDELAHRAASRD